MPTVAIIDGIKIQFYPDEHPPPHFHAILAEYAAQIRIDPPSVLRGSLPLAKLDAVLNWTLNNRDALMQAWMALAAGRKPDKLK